MPKKQITALSFGGGIQTTALALMLEAGLLGPRPDVAVFADTGAEPPHVYETIDWLRGMVAYPLITGHARGNLEADLHQQLDGVTNWRRAAARPDFVDIPAYSTDGAGAITKRQCTTVYKIDVIRRTLLEWAECKHNQIAINQLIGISYDEAMRMKPSRVDYITHAYPLVDARLTRLHCIDWLTENHPGHPAGRSACFFCPYKSKPEWNAIRRRYPELWARALELDSKLKGVGLTLVKPPATLEGVEAQLDFGAQWLAECAGHCGV